MGEKFNFFRVPAGSEGFKNKLGGLNMRSFPINSNPLMSGKASVTVWKAARLLSGDDTRRYAVGKRPDGTFVAEFDNGTRQSVFRVQIKNTGSTVWASHVENPASPIIKPLPYKIETASVSGSGGEELLAVFMYALDCMNDSEYKSAYATLLPNLGAGDQDPFFDDPHEVEEIGERLVRLEEVLLRKLQGFSVPDENVKLKPFRLEWLKQSVTFREHDEPVFFMSASAPVKKGEYPPEFQAIRKMAEDAKLTAEYSEEEQKLIPFFPPEYVPSPIALKWARYILASREYAEPYCTLALFGPAGTGKTSICRYICSALNRPYVTTSGFPEMDLIDLIGQVFINPEQSVKVDMEAIRKNLELPTVDEIIFDPETAYISVYGEKYDGQEAGEIITEVNNRIFSRVREMMTENKDYIFVPGPLTLAMRYGYGFELQEAKNIRRKGVLVGINHLMVAGRNVRLSLPTGESFIRHENAFVFFTANDEYDSAVDLDQSVLSRLSNVILFENPKAHVLAERAKFAVPDFPNDTRLMEMASVIGEINEYCEEKGISDGVCGQRELNNWAMQSMIIMKCMDSEELATEYVREAAQTAVLNKVSQQRENILDVAIAKINSKFGEWDMTL